MASEDEFDDSTVLLLHLLESNSSRKIMQSQGLWLSSLYLRNFHPKFEEFMELMENKSDLEFFKLSQVTRKTLRMLCDMLSSHAEFQVKHFGVEVSIITLWYVGRQCTFSEISEQFRISECGVHTQIWKVLNIINDVYKNVIKWPTFEEVAQVEKEFRSLNNFPGVIAAIDGCHIKIRAPEEFQKDYLDRTMSHSINLLAACDANKKFLYINAGFPGSAHDQRVLTNSDLGIQLENNYKSLCYSDFYHIIGDSAFALKPYMMVPYRDTGDLDVKKLNFNAKLSMSRRVIEDSFAWLKGRFRRLKYIEADLERVTKIVTSACILHNITIDFEEERELLLNNIESDHEETIEVALNTVQESAKGINKRNRIMNNLMN